MKVYDSVIIGGGFAGLSAAIYLGRFNRSVVVIDNESGRWNTFEVNENYLGFPKGIKSRELRERGIEQAQEFGAEFVIDTITEIKKEDSLFVSSGNKNYRSKTIILATGVHDLFPHFNKWAECLGRSLFWCITCDGYKAINKKVLIIGKNDDAAETAMQFLEYTKDIVVLTNCEEKECQVSDEFLDRFRKADIKIMFGNIKDVEGSRGYVSKVITDKGEEIPVDLIFNQQGAVPKSDLAKQLGVEVDRKGYIKTDNDQRTNILKVYAAGDVTKAFAHQTVTAAHEGSMAAQAANYDLYRPEQRE